MFVEFNVLVAQLRSKLTSDELQQFALILRDYRQTGSIKDFCKKLQTLYGPERKLLFPGKNSNIFVNLFLQYFYFLTVVALRKKSSLKMAVNVGGKPGRAVDSIKHCENRLPVKCVAFESEVISHSNIKRLQA